MARVDIHCHTFNGDDLPVRGFVRRVVGSKVAVARALDWVVDTAVQGRAPGFGELADLDRRLQAGPRAEPEVDASAAAEGIALDAEELLRQLERDAPALAEAAKAELPAMADEYPGEAEADGLDDVREVLKRYVSWAGLFGRSRWNLTSTVMALYPGVDLFTTLLVDFPTLGDKAATTSLQQIELHERISRLTLLGHAPSVVLPFVGFDPRRNGALAFAKEAVHYHGAVGVKLYPPMGFRPFGNRGHLPPQMDDDEAFAADDQLSRLYDWCCNEDVPVTAHCNPSNYAHAGFIDFSGPAEWERVLKEWPELRLNLGHSGWGRWDAGWPHQIARLMADHPHLYADMGNHSLEHLATTLDRVQDLVADPATSTFGQRFMFGTDWFMLASSASFETFLVDVESAYRAQFPEQGDSFMGDTALAFLGFSQPTNKNAARLVERCDDLRVSRPSWSHSGVD